MKLSIKCWSIFLLLSSSMVFAESIYNSDCIFRGKYHQFSECLNTEWDKVDQELNSVYLHYYARGKDKNLRAAERLWIHLNDVDCESWLQDVTGSKEYLLMSYACLINKEKGRIRDLQKPLSYGVCSNKINNQDLILCLQSERNKYDKQLKMLTKNLSNFAFEDEKNLKKLRGTLAYLWNEFTEKDCAYKASKATKKEEQQLYYEACLMDNTQQRVSELKKARHYDNWV